MDLSEKIKQILSQKNISPSIFADEIGIQRSSISHILAGRNKPSLDIVQKIIKRFPDLGINWILDDEELPDQMESMDGSKSVDKHHQGTLESTNTSPRHLDRKNDPAPTPAQENLRRQKLPIEEPKQVDRILVFYTDGTFKEFRQA